MWNTTKNNKNDPLHIIFTFFVTIFGTQHVANKKIFILDSIM